MKKASTLINRWIKHNRSWLSQELRDNNARRSRLRMVTNWFQTPMATRATPAVYAQRTRTRARLKNEVGESEFATEAMRREIKRAEDELLDAKFLEKAARISKERREWLADKRHEYDV